jgi:hypothetical protein
MSLETIAGYYVGPTSLGHKNFQLKTAKGLLNLSCEAQPPPMREDDQIIINVWNGSQIVSITNLGTGTEFHYRILEPNGPYRFRGFGLRSLFCGGMIVAFMMVASFLGGAFSQMHYGHAEYGTVPMLLGAFVSYLIFMAWGLSWRSSDHHNQCIDREIQERIHRAACDVRTWQTQDEK